MRDKAAEIQLMGLEPAELVLHWDCSSTQLQKRNKQKGGITDERSNAPKIEQELYVQMPFRGKELLDARRRNLGLFNKTRGMPRPVSNRLTTVTGKAPRPAANHS